MTNKPLYTICVNPAFCQCFIVTRHIMIKDKKNVSAKNARLVNHNLQTVNSTLHTICSFVIWNDWNCFDKYYLWVSLKNCPIDANQTKSVRQNTSKNHWRITLYTLFVVFCFLPVFSSYSRIVCTALYVYVLIERAHLVNIELRPWHNIRINFSQNKPNRSSLSIKLEFLEIFEI